METWYLVSRYSNSVKPVRVIKSTAQCIWIKGEYGEQRALKTSEYDQYFDSESKAVEALRSRLLGQLNSAKKQVVQYENALANLPKRF